MRKPPRARCDLCRGLTTAPTDLGRAVAVVICQKCSDERRNPPLPACFVKPVPRFVPPKPSRPPEPRKPVYGSAPPTPWFETDERAET